MKAVLDSPKVLGHFSRCVSAVIPAGGSPEFHSECKWFLRHLDEGKKRIKLAVEADKRRDVLSHVYVNQEFSLKNMSTFGFDYDYTISHYKPLLLESIYNAAKTFLVENKGYPLPHRELQYDPDFAIRGLCFDEANGTIIKVDRHYVVQGDSVYRGRSAVAPTDVKLMYPGRIASKSSLHPMNDFYSLAETNLLADIVEVFERENIEYESTYICTDVRTAIQQFHSSGELHKLVMDNPAQYIEYSPETIEFLIKLKEANRFTFLMTNSGYSYVSAGMKYLYDRVRPNGSHWRDLFDIVICKSQKPDFYSGARKFRTRDENGATNWARVSSFDPKSVYVGGSLGELKRIAGEPFAAGHETLFFGDHLWADLIAAKRLDNWKTALILSELEEETRLLATEEYQCLAWEVTRIESLLERSAMERIATPEFTQTLKDRRQLLRTRLKKMFNRQFGSPFRTFSGPSLLQDYISRYASVYSSSLSDWNRTPLDYTFYRNARVMLPHEECTRRTYAR